MFNLLRRWWWLLLLGLLIGTGLGYRSTQNIIPVYQATTRLFINQVQSPGAVGYNDLLTSERLAKTYAELLRSRPVLEETARQLGVPYVQAPAVTVVRDTALLQVTIQDTDPVRATTIVNQLALVFIERSQDLIGQNDMAMRQQIDGEVQSARQRIADTSAHLEQLRATTTPDSAEIQRVQSELAQYQDTYSRLLVAQQQVQLAAAQASSQVSVAEEALVPGSPINPGRRQSLALGALMGLIVAAGLVLLYEYLDDRVRDPEEVRRRYSVAPLALISRVKGDAQRLLTRQDKVANDEFTEALRLLRTNLDFLMMGGTRVVCVSSSIPQEGKTTIACNLAIVEAQAGRRVALIDADLRDPAVHRLFDLRTEQGLSTYLAQAPAQEVPAFQDGPLGIRILPCGPIPPNPSELLNSPRLADLIETLRGEVDLIIVDSAPILPVADTLALCQGSC